MLWESPNITPSQSKLDQSLKHLFLHLLKFFGLSLSFITFFSPVEGMSQGEFNNWYFGNRAGVTFNSGVPVSFLSSMMAASGGTVSVSDSIGNILFYCNVSAVYNKNNVAMPNGWPFYAYGGGFNQPVLAVQKPNTYSIYYLFLAGQVTLYPSTTYPPMWSIINMSLDGGLGDIEPGFKNIPLNGGLKAWNAVTGIRHKNNHDAWVVVRFCDTDSNYFASYLISDAGLNTNPIYSLSRTFTNSNIQPFETKAHQIKISPDGKKLVCLYATDTLEFCNFVSDSGIVHSLFTFKPKFNGDSIILQNAEFSIDSKLLYISGKLNSPPWKTIILQFNASLTDSTQFGQSQTKIGLSSRNQALQMAVDGKIYCSPNGIDSLSVIDAPSIQGVGCGFQENIVSLRGRQSGNGLPQFVQRYKAYIHQSGNCQNSSIHFSGDVWPPPDSIHWNFGDPASGVLNFSNLANPEHVYLVPGTYMVELFVRHIDNRTDTSWMTITIVASPQVNLGSDRTICAGTSATFDAGFCTGCSYEWKDISSGLTVGTNQSYTTNLSGNYCVIVTNTNGCTSSDTIQLFTTTIPQLTNNPLYDSICSGETTNIPLTSIPPSSIFNWTANLTSGTITGFSADSGLVISQTLINTGSAAGIVTYHITPKIGSCAGVPVDLLITVVVGDSVKVSITASLNNICAGTSVTFTATPTNPGTTPVYQWKVNSVNTGANSPTFIYTPINGDLVQCILTSSNTVCTSNNPATSNAITMVVNPNLPVSVSVSPSLNPICTGTLVTFTATPTYGGLTPSYQWKVNGANVGTNSSTYSYIPNNGDVITCTLTSSETCTTGNPATSVPVSMTVNPLLPVSISISPSSNPFCIGSSEPSPLRPTYPGTTPVYQWKVNGLNVGANNISYTYNPVSGDVVTCILTSSEPCTSGNPATSNTITMIGNLGLPASVSITAVPNPFCPGSSVTCTATPNNGGTNPIYQWKVNGLNVGTNLPTYTFNPLNNDSVRCVMTSNLSCVSGNPASSIKIVLSGTLAPVVTFTTCFDTITTLNAKPIKLKGGVPLNGTYSGPGVNPATGVFTPLAAGLGIKTITYSYTNVALCSASKTKTILVQAVPAFTCGNNLTDIRDNKIYPTVQIGSQCWMASNLNYGSLIPGNTHQRDNCVNEKYCYNDLAVNCGTQAYYQWDELMRYDDTPVQQGLCPPGWHLPTEAEWNTLFSVYISNGFAGSPLKYSGYSGFNAMLSGVSHQNVQWDFQNFATVFTRII
jgi:uncharacterized protein (TIGR02145 family)